MGNPGKGLIFHSVQVSKLLQVSRAVTTLRTLSHSVIAVGSFSSNGVKSDQLFLCDFRRIKGQTGKNV